VAGAVIGVLLAAWFFGLRFPGVSTHPPQATESDSPSAIADILPSRPVYKYSVVNGGAYTTDELARAIARDPVVAAHYRTVNIAHLRAETVADDRFAYMSYRRGDQIYWTRHKVRLRQGETILTDGTTQVRARCGNCISLTPMDPVAETDPDMVEFEALMDDPVIPIPAGPLMAIAGPAPTLPPGLLLAPPFGDAPIGAIGETDPFPVAPVGDPDVAESVAEIISSPIAPGFDPGATVVPFPQIPGTPPNGQPGNPGDPGGPHEKPPVLVEVPFDPSTPLEDPGTPVDPETPVPAPEPGTILLVGGGLGAMIRRLRARQ
jgi:hypothetical protein